jgi:hypothetical protein
MALEGTLRDFSLADIFQLIGLQRKTGVLTLRSTEDVVTIQFVDGKVVGADSLNKRIEDRLGQVLLKTGMISAAALDSALKVQVETLERLGIILLRQAALSREELRRALERQILQIIYRVFRWQDGDYHFSQETSVEHDVELFSPIAAESILMEGARMLDEWPIIEKGIPDRSIIYVPTSAAANAEMDPDETMKELDPQDADRWRPRPVPKGTLRISPIEHEILRFVDGVSTVQDVVAKSAHGEFDTCKALFTLVNRGLIREASRDELARLAEAALEEQPVVAAKPAPTFPWQVLLLIPLLAVSLTLAPRNPLNLVLGAGPNLVPKLRAGASWSGMLGVWHALQARAVLAGGYPETLGDLVRERIVPQRSLEDPWGRPYRYSLREQSVFLTGSTAAGNPDPNLIMTQHLGSATDEAVPKQGATLINP